MLISLQFKSFFENIIYDWYENLHSVNTSKISHLFDSLFEIKLKFFKNHVYIKPFELGEFAMWAEPKPLTVGLTSLCIWPGRFHKRVASYSVPWHHGNKISSHWENTSQGPISAKWKKEKVFWWKFIRYYCEKVKKILNKKFYRNFEFH